MLFNPLASLKGRLLCAFGLVLLLLAGIVGLGVWNGRAVQAHVHGMLSQDFAAHELVAEIDGLTKRNSRNTLELFLTPPDARTAVRGRMGEVKTRLDGLFQQLEPLLTTPQGQALFAEVKSKRQGFVAAFTNAANTLQGGDEVGAQLILQREVLPAIDDLGASIQKLLTLQQGLAHQRGQQVQDRMHTNNLLAIVLGLVAVGCGLAAALWMIRSLMRPLGVAMAAAEKIRQGDLTARIEVQGNDELSRLLESLEQMREALAQVVMRIHEGTAQVSAASSQIAAANQDLSARTESQASSLEETAASMEQMTGSVRQNAQITHLASQMSGEASRTAREVGQLVNSMVQTMQDIHLSSQRIRDIVGVIDSIAFQTNILALNAAVEAARAGEHGRGFAVVASEVRSLAQHSANAAQEIKTIIQDNATKMDTGNAIAQKAGESVVAVVSAIEGVNQTVSEVATATREQTAGIEQVGQAVQSLDETTQQNAALVEETAAATLNLDDQVRSLSTAVHRFRTANGSGLQRLP